MADLRTQAQPLHDVITAGMQELHIPGVGLGVIFNGEEHTAGFGITNINHPLEVTPDTLFQIGSITKTFVGTAVMRLVEQGRITLDTPVREWLPDFQVQDPVTSEQVTMRNLLNHTSGWVGDYFDETGNGDDALAQIVARMANLPQMSAIGEVWSYSNSGFYVAGRMIEVITGQTFEDALTDLVLKPLGMTHTFLHPTDVMVHRYATGHDVRDDEPRIAAPWPLTRCTNAAGGLISSPNDMLRYARFQLSNGLTPDGDRLLSEESLDTMRAPATPIDTIGNHVGITWMVRTIGGQTYYTHSGGTNGQISIFAVAPERQLGVVVVTNADCGGQLTGRVVAKAFETLLGVTATPSKPGTRSADEAAEYIGDYHAALSHVEVRASEDGTALTLQMLPQGGFPLPTSPADPPSPVMRIGWHGTDQFEVLEGPAQGTRGEFLRDPDGSLAWLRLGSRAARRQS